MLDWASKGLTLDLDEAQSLIKQLPDDLEYFYFRDRESAWLLMQQIEGSASIAELRRTPFGKLLQRPLVRTCIATRGDGKLFAGDLLPAAEPDSSMPKSGWNRPQAAGLEASYASTWHDFRLSFDLWNGQTDRLAQVSRPGINIVIQMSFSSDHSAYLGKLHQINTREVFQFEGHPIRIDGNPTLAWSRVDIDTKHKTALIEEIQSDWLRIVRQHVRDLEKRRPDSEELRIYSQYLEEIEDRYARDWPRAIMLATLKILRSEFGCRSVFFHTPESGVSLKGNYNAPKSLYTSLPGYFCFSKTDRWPPFIRKSIQKQYGPGCLDKDIRFWLLEFPDPTF